MKVTDLKCPNCRNTVTQSLCEPCRKRKIHSYKCQKCGTNIPNPEYGDR